MKHEDGLAAEVVRAAAFRSALRRFLRHTEVAAAGAGLTGQRYNLLLMIGAAEVEGRPATITALTERLELPQSAVTELVKRAEEAGLVRRRQPSEDRRVRLVELTAEGEQRLTYAFASLRRDRAELALALRELTRRFD